MELVTTTNRNTDLNIDQPRGAYFISALSAHVYFQNGEKRLARIFFTYCISPAPLCRANNLITPATSILQFPYRIISNLCIIIPLKIFFV